MTTYDDWKLSPPPGVTCDECGQPCPCECRPCCDAGNEGHPGPHWHEE